MLVLFALELMPPVQAAFVVPWTETLADFCVLLVMMFDTGVISHGKVIIDQQSSFAVSIEAGCNAVEACIILVAAIMAFPAPWKYKAWGLLAGIAAVQVVNVLRVISLFYLGQWRMDVFEFAHLYLWQALIMLDVLFVWLVWMRTLPHPVQVEHAEG